MLFVLLTIIYRRNYFEEEEVDLNEFTTSWLQYLLSKEMKFENLIRLWGKCYFVIITVKQLLMCVYIARFVFRYA